eukprot:gene2172-4223_t
MEFFGSVMEDAIPIILKWSLAIWAVIEIIFYFCITWILVPMLQPRKAPQKSMFKNPVEMMRDIYNLLESVASYSFDQFCSGFSLYSHIDDIHTENFDSFLSWAVFTSHFHDLTEFQKETIRDLRIEALQKFDMNMKEGHNISVKHAKFNLEHAIEFNIFISLMLKNHSLDKVSIISHSWEDIPHNIPMLIALGGNDDMISAPCANEMIDKYISKRKNENSKKYEKKINLNKENRTSTATSTSSVVKLFWKDLAHGEAINNKNTVFAIKKVLDENENFLFDF